MPVKQDTELQLLRALSNTPLQVDVTFVKIASHNSTHTSANHLNKFYVTFDEIKNKKFDNLISFDVLMSKSTSGKSEVIR